MAPVNSLPGVESAGPSLASTKGAGAPPCSAFLRNSRRAAALFSGPRASPTFGVACTVGPASFPSQPTVPHYGGAVGAFGNMGAPTASLDKNIQIGTELLMHQATARGTKQIGRIRSKLGFRHSAHAVP
jgi:hypothetical protein